MVITCNAIGWPPPNLSWLSSSEQVTKFSHSFNLEGSGYSSLSLEFAGGTLPSDSGSYTCFVSGSSRRAILSDSVTITLEVITGEITSNTILRCPLGSPTVFFQLQVLNSNCEYEDPDPIEKVVGEISDVLIGGVISQCEECVISGNTLTVSRGPLCSVSKSRVTVFLGEISTTDAELTRNIFCGLRAWYESIPLIRINNELKLIDQDCTLQVESLDIIESCKGANTEKLVVETVVIVPVALGLVIIISTVVVVILMACYKR